MTTLNVLTGLLGVSCSLEITPSIDWLTIIRFLFSQPKAHVILLEWRRPIRYLIG